MEIVNLDAITSMRAISIFAKPGSIGRSVAHKNFEEDLYFRIFKSDTRERLENAQNYKILVKLNGSKEIVDVTEQIVERCIYAYFASYGCFNPYGDDEMAVVNARQIKFFGKEASAFEKMGLPMHAHKSRRCIDICRGWKPEEPRDHSDDDNLPF
ncbi:hypothetical protein ACELLULO517_15600 [Acidisoma cellulosilytica]|uniref:Uncharacterized protein n=1 Tax=Acidisoma cellulosilyticum TaxID=2802395 RepID=A0A964E4S2_9PROT|nr:hypothetical protein [Acidisoma cellulosilyticum]MCB8881672.1 hypothetical protein [Acidisoma cellulosilyticum]